ncbi:MAG: hypothetical protein ABIY70_15075 [Capsulimonas sp.]|uniref:hypothetical protein n=1 Tax=Capsulimonas sp. TaxID=2494211 RepID=UPI0032663E1A
MATYKRGTDELEQRLVEITRLKEEVEAYGTLDFASSLGLKSIQCFEQQTQEELKAARLSESEYSLAVAVDGDPVRNHAINGKFFGQLLVALQDCLNSVALAQTRGRELKKNIIPGNRLVLAATGPGSFEASFILPEPEPTEESSNTLMVVEPTQTPVGILSQLLDGTIDVDTSSEILSDTQVKSKYALLMNLISKEGAIISVRTKDDPYGVRLTTQEARDRNDWLDLLKSSIEEENISGTLIAGNIVTGRFTIKTTNGTISGRSSEEAAKQLKTMRLSSTVTAKIQVTTTSHQDSTFVPSISYLLLSIKEEETMDLFATPLPLEPENKP